MTTAQTIKYEIAKKLEINVTAIDDKSSIESLGADELDKIEILMSIENAFEIDIEDDEFFNCTTISAIVALVEYLLKRK
jgi:acyl carrier protein